ncbi:MAG: energy-coupling factor transporter ATPase [Clostridiales bacterium]|nr:energy-coupling factor transporter ATPase [Clostridiales bacterium]
MDTIIELKNITYVYGSGTPFQMTALDDVSVKIKAGFITGLIGHTGSGKSTLVQMLNGLLRPHAGQVLLHNKDIWENPKEISSIRFKVGLVMQYPEYQLFDETVGKDIAFGPKNMKLSDEEIARRVEEAASFVGIDKALLDKSPFDLSGGQKRRVAIAGIIAMRPDVLVLDEPAAGLDPRGRKEILGRVRQYQRDTGAAVIIVSHSMEDMAKYCDEIIVMNRARIFAQGSCAEIFARAEELVAVGLDVPQIAYIAQALRRGGCELEGDIYTVEGALSALVSLFEKKGIPRKTANNA